jgi:hypothetical protein
MILRRVIEILEKREGGKGEEGQIGCFFFVGKKLFNHEFFLA